VDSETTRPPRPKAKPMMAGRHRDVERRGDSDAGKDDRGQQVKWEIRELGN